MAFKPFVFHRKQQGRAQQNTTTTHISHQRKVYIATINNKKNVAREKTL